MKRKLKKMAKGFFIGMCLIGATMFVGLWVFLYLVFTGGPAKITTDLADYDEVLANPYVQTGYIVFPEELPEGIEEAEFYNYYRDTWNSPTIQTYLKCQYDEQTYQQEIYRLENTSKTYGNRKMELLRDEKKKFQYPAYIAVENAAHKYEYALLTGEREIVYINTSFIDKEEVYFSETYLPYDFMTEEGRGFGSGYSIYYRLVRADGISIDYSRDPMPEVTDAHSRMIGDDFFVVRVKLDSQGREIITECAYCPYELGSFEGIEEVVYHELDGMEYKDLEVDYEKNIATVTYLEQDQECTCEFDLKLNP